MGDRGFCRRNSVCLKKDPPAISFNSKSFDMVIYVSVNLPFQKISKSKRQFLVDSPASYAARISGYERSNEAAGYGYGI